MLHDEYQVRPEDLRWHLGSQDGVRRSSLTGFDPGAPPHIGIENVPQGQSLSEMLESGRLDALIAILLPAPFLRGSPRVQRLFPNYKEVEADYFRRTGIFPIMHTLVIREDVHKTHPWAAVSLYEAFRRAKEIAVEALYDTDAPRATLPFLVHHVEETRALFGDDFWPYGVESSRATLDAAARYMVEQGLAARRLSVEEMFPAETYGGSR
jgi:4,5-dihydroxyphthalate decarboxylase